MNPHTTTYLTYAALTGAVVMWIGVVYFAELIQTTQAAYVAQTQELTQQSDQAASDALVHIVASGNLARSTALDALVAPDISSIIGTITSVGTSAGVPIKISGAMPESASKNQKDVHTVSFVIEGTGSFSSLIHVLALLEAVPISSSIDMIDLSQVPKSGDTTGHAPQAWHLNLKMHVLTTAPVSS